MKHSGFFIIIRQLHQKKIMHKLTDLNKFSLESIFLQSILKGNQDDSLVSINSMRIDSVISSWRPVRNGPRLEL